jgi:pyridoxal biosynthesis lyase PdxS
VVLKSAYREAVTIPVMAKCRIGHFIEAQILQAVGVDFVDESEFVASNSLALADHGTGF